MIGRSDRVQIRRALLAWYQKSKRDLPWRRTSDPYAIWLSEVMLQQTRVESVIPYYERFLAAFPTVQALAKAPLERVLKMWAGLGYYSRARNLHAAAKAVVRDHAGRFPRSSTVLQTLPGVGRYSAAAIASIAFAEDTAVLDGNVKRVLARLLPFRRSIDTPAANDRFWMEANRLLDCRKPGDFNQAMMELGATICTPRNPRCEACPVLPQCAAAKLGLAAKLPVRKKKAAVPRVKAVGAAILKGDKILLVQRKNTGLLAGFWTLPGGELQIGEPAHEALIRHASEQLGTTIRVGEKLGEVRHEFTHRSLRLEVFAAHLINRDPSSRFQASKRNGLHWHQLNAEPAVPLATIDKKAVGCVWTAQKDSISQKRSSRSKRTQQPRATLPGFSG